MRCRTVLDALGDDVALSHTSACVAQRSTCRDSRWTAYTSRGSTAARGRSRATWPFWTHSLPLLQCEIHDRGRLVGRTDWGGPKLRRLGESDGKVKYGRLLKPGQKPGDVVFREKQREDRVREIAGAWMIRLVWADLGEPARTAQRVLPPVLQRRGGALGALPRPR